MNSSPDTIVADVELGRVLVQAADRSILASVGVDSHGALDDVRAWAAAIDEITGYASPSGVVVRATEVGLVGVDAHGVLVHPVLWAHDERSAPDAAWCRKKHDDAWWESEVGAVPEHLHLVTKLSWLHRSEPEAWERSRFFCSFEDYLRWSLVATGIPERFVTRPGVVETFGLWGRGEYRTAVLSLIDAERDWSGVLPEVGVEGRLLGTWHQIDVRL